MIKIEWTTLLLVLIALTIFAGLVCLLVYDASKQIKINNYCVGLGYTSGEPITGVSGKVLCEEVHLVDYPDD